MTLKKISHINGGQDGAIYNGMLFSFNSCGECFVYDLEMMDEIGSFTLDKVDALKPHSNSVMFGSKFYHLDDEFPLLYTNIYNNYAKTDNPMKGVCCVYRLQRNGKDFSSTLVQIIEVGFIEDTNYWKSSDIADKRPYGNFAIDKEKEILYAFVMRDEENKTRYFSFNLPKISQGEVDENFNVKKVVLTVKDILEYFDCEYHRFVQGSCVHKGKIYSLEGFTDNAENPAAMRIIDPDKNEQEKYINLSEMGYKIEPELIDFSGDTCYYADHNGNLYIIE